MSQNITSLLGGLLSLPQEPVTSNLMSNPSNDETISADSAESRDRIAECNENLNLQNSNLNDCRETDGVRSLADVQGDRDLVPGDVNADRVSAGEFEGVRTQCSANESAEILPAIESSEVNKHTSSKKHRDLDYLNALQNIEQDRLSRHFLLDHQQIEITSLDITPHGCYILAGCSNGMVLLYDMTSTSEQGHVIGHIFAKGLHTSLLLVVKVTDDCRFCFAGVHKGSSELLAIDLGSLPVYRLPLIKPTTKPPTHDTFQYDLIKTFRHSDAKLRGFSTAVRVGSPTDGRDVNTYRLACGKGIKNVHVWQFEPPSEIGKDPTWTCICDVASNGMTIENIVFRAAGRAFVSKSSDANLRVWDLSAYDNSPMKPPYEDISNSQDMKAVFDNFAFGGTYNFAVVQITAPKAANRDSFEMPERSIEDEKGNRRKRMMRQISEVIGTHDGRHVLALCSDGSIMYYSRNDDESADMVEFNDIQRDPDVDGVWAIHRVGSRGQAVLLRAVKSADQKYTSIFVDTLENLTDVVQSTILPEDPTWNPWGYYCNAPKIELPGPAENSDPNPTKKAQPSAPDKKASSTPKPQPKKATSASKSNQTNKTPVDKLASLIDPTPASVVKLPSTGSSLKSKFTAYRTPDLSNLAAVGNKSSTQVSREASKSSPHDDITRLIYDHSNASPKRVSTRTVTVDKADILVKRTREKVVNFASLESGDYLKTDEVSEVDNADEIQVPKRIKFVYNAPRIQHTVESHVVHPMIIPSEIAMLNKKVATIKYNWTQSIRTLSSTECFDSKAYLSGLMLTAQLDVIAQDHDRIRAQFSTEVSSVLTQQYQRVAAALQSFLLDETVPVPSLEQLQAQINASGVMNSFTHEISSALCREQVDLDIAYRMDRYLSAQPFSPAAVPRVSFQYAGMVSKAKELEVQIQGAIADGLRLCETSAKAYQYDQRIIC